MSWFINWFDSPYYHILYKNRDEKEAEFFIENLVQYLNLKKRSKLLDIACGKGRHVFVVEHEDLAAAIVLTKDRLSHEFGVLEVAQLGGDLLPPNRWDSEGRDVTHARDRHVQGSRDRSRC